jgi:two-component system chemotaxis sensor kinase CheA
VDDAFRCVHTIKGNAGFLGYDAFENICMEMESILDSVRSGDRQVEPKVVTTLLKILDSMHDALNSLGQDSEAAGRDNDAGETVEQDSQYKPIGEILIEMGETTSEDVEEALDSQERRVGEILVAEGKVSGKALEDALEKQGRAAAKEQAGQPGYRAERKDIRVDMAKLDKLFNLMGELITAEAMVIHSPELENLELESFSRSANYLSKITREMQEITMTVRMIPLEGLFNKMRRLVRDLARKFGKRINLLVSGQETEMDRNVIEEISDPLVHILRNAIDHGIEDEEIRRNAGKEQSGTVSLDAKYEGNEIWISVKDDGAGLNRERILDKAEERGILTAERESMTDAEVWQLVLAPGFSTAEQVTEVSGRGVGMDVVKRNIEKLRGKIDINVSPAEGTEVILRIPLTLAIIDSITVKVGTFVYALPLGDILEFHKASDDQITSTNTRREVLKLREEIVPVIKLHEFFNTESIKSSTWDGLLLITQAHNKKAALLVDEILGYQQIVVKALPDYLGEMRAISGCSVMGNGEVCLIIDTGSLLIGELE